MLQLVSKTLSRESKAELDRLQGLVNNAPTFKGKVAEAKKLWGKKDGKTFDEIIEVLQFMSVYIKVCNYCEQNQGHDIEHIYPKSYFPELAFVWENYLYACPRCNRVLKLDNCFILDVSGERIKLKRGTEPTRQSIAFINPRTENPADFMVMRLEDYKFGILDFQLNKAGINKALTSIEILELNIDDTLLDARKKAANYYFHRMKLLVDLLKATSIEDLETILAPNDEKFIDKNLSLQQQKDSFKQTFRKEISTYMHPSVNVFAYIETYIIYLYIVVSCCYSSCFWLCIYFIKHIYSS